MKVAIAGGTGLVGKKLCDVLKARGDEVIVLTRGASTVKENIQYVNWLGEEKPERALEGIDVFVNLAGVSLNDGRWTEERKQAIYTSRMDATNEVLRIIENLETKPQVLINASAVGIYPTSTSAIYTEQSNKLATDFLGQVVTDWEQKANQATALGVRVCLARLGVVLEK